MNGFTEERRVPHNDCFNKKLRPSLCYLDDDRVTPAIKGGFFVVVMSRYLCKNRKTYNVYILAQHLLHCRAY